MHHYSAAKYSSSHRNILARIKSLILKGLKEQTYLPKAIVFVLDDDLIKQSSIRSSNARNGDYQIILKYLMEEAHRIITTYKEGLPKKSKQPLYPHFIWVIPPTHKYFHNNALREYFAFSTEKEVEKYPNMCGLRLKKIWDKKDGSLYLQEQRRFLQQGNIDYWRAVDAAVKFWDKTLGDIMVKCQKKVPMAESTYHHKFTTMGKSHSRDSHHGRDHEDRRNWTINPTPGNRD